VEEAARAKHSQLATMLSTYKELSQCGIVRICTHLYGLLQNLMYRMTKITDNYGFVRLHCAITCAIMQMYCSDATRCPTREDTQ
jgi:hypothetical protein